MRPVAGGASLSDGTGVWWLASQSAPSRAGGAADAPTLTAPAMPPATQLADAALAEWLKFFAGHTPAESGEDE
eukprot:1659217-Prymnesium_polylepis.2